MPKTTRTWIMIADAGRARFFLNEGPAKALQPIQDAVFENPNAHGHSRDLVSDKPGRSMDSAGGQHHAMEPRTDPHRQAKTEFAKKMADYIERGASEDRFDRLVLVAPPPMLGDLREALGRHAAKRLKAELAKDLTKIPIAELPAHLESVLSARA